MCGLFKDSQACQGDYIAIKESTAFPQEVLPSLLENVNVAVRASETFTHVKNFVQDTKFPRNITCSNNITAIV